MRIDQTGRSVGIPGFARPDLLSNGATVQLTDTTAGGTSSFDILYLPPNDTDSVASLAPMVGNDHIWTFNATVGVEGPWRVRLRHILPNGSLIEEIRILGFSASGSGAIPPAPNEQASKDASELNKTDSDIIFKSERNWPTADYPLGNPYGWSDSVAGGGGGAVASVFGRTGTVVAVANDYSASLVSNNSSVVGTTVKDALDTLLTSTVTSVFGRTGTIFAVAGDYPASKITNDSSVSGATVKDALNTLLSSTTLQAAYTAGATVTFSSTDIVMSKSSVELLRVGSAATLKAADKTTTGATGDAVQLLGSKGGAAAVAGSPGDGGTVTITAGTVGSETAAPGGSVGAASTAHVVIQGGAGGNVSGIKAGSVFLHGGQIGTGSAGGTNVPGDVKIGTDANKTHTVRSGQSGGTPWEHQGPMWTPMVTLADGATITISSDKSCSHKVIIGGARTLDFAFPASYSNSIVNPTGLTGYLVVQQDSGGGKTLAFAAKIKTSGDVTLNSAANAITVFVWVLESPTIIHLRKVEASSSVGTGDFVGPGSSVSGNIVSFNGTTGKLGQDSGVAAASVVVGPASVVTARIATFSGTTGKLIQDSGSLITDLVPTTRTITAGTGLTGGGDLSANRTLTVASAPALTSATTTVNVSAATAPISGQALVATSPTTATWQTLGGGAPSGAAGGDLGSTYPNPTVIALHSATTAVNVGSATAPTAGQALIATSSVAATWQSISAGGFSVGSDINPLHWWRADNTVQSSGLVDTIVDNGSSVKSFTQSGTPRCPTAVDANGKTYLAPDGANDFYQAGAVADWKFLNDGSPWTICLVYQRAALVVANESIIDTTDGTTGSTGMFIIHAFTSSVKQGPQCAITNSIGGSDLLVTNSLVPNTNLEVLIIRHTGTSFSISAGSTSTPIDMSMRRQGAHVSQCNSTGGYANTNPSFVLTLFRRSSTSGSFSAARLYELIIHNTALTDGQLQGYESYAHLVYGTPGSNAVVASTTATALATTGASVVVNTATPPVAGQALVATSSVAATWQALSGSTAFSVANNIGPAHWWRADNTVQSSGLVDTIVDNGSAPLNFTQTSTPRCPTAVDGLGNTYLAPDGSVDFYQAGVAADWAFLHNGSPFTVAIVFQRAALIVATETLLDTANGSSANIGVALGLSYVSATVQGPFFYIGAGSLGNQVQALIQKIPNTNLEVLIVRHNGDGTVINTAVDRPIDATMRRGGRLAGVSQRNTGGTAYSASAAAGALTLFRASAGSTLFGAARVYDIIVDTKAWNDNQCVGYEEYARVRYGVPVTAPVVSSNNGLTRGRTPIWVPPASAGLCDDEFDSTTLNPAYIFRDTTTGPTNRTPTTATIAMHTALALSTTPPVYNVHTNGRRSFLLIQTPAASAPTYVIAKPFTFTAGNFYYSSFGCLVTGQPSVAVGANIRLAIMADSGGNPDLTNYVFVNLRDVSGVANINCGTVVGGSLTNNNVLALSAGQPYPNVMIQNWGSVGSPKWDLGVFSDDGAYQLLGNNLTPGSMGTPAWIGWVVQNGGATVPNVFAIDYLRESTTHPLYTSQTTLLAGPSGATGPAGTVAFNAANSFTWSSNAASLNTSAGGDFTATNTLTGNSTLTLTSGVDGAQGLIYVKQDSTGGRTITFSIAGRTILRDANSIDDNPESTASSLTVYSYHYVTVAGTACTRITRVFL